MKTGWMLFSGYKGRLLGCAALETAGGEQRMLFVTRGAAK